jgi:hypothetical protein
MPGPPPKDPALRQRRNRAATGATLSLAPTGIEPPPLPDRKDDDGNVLDWHPMALDFWTEVWSSPMAAEYLDADVPGLFILAALTDAYWKAVDAGKVGKELAAEIRLQRIDYGLTPIARRRLQWEVERAEDAQDRGRRRRPTRGSDGDGSKPADKGADPRLAAVR